MDDEASRPLILTLEFEPTVQEWAQTMRSIHFPAERNIVPAHVTLFHALPPESRNAIAMRLGTTSEKPEVTIGAPYLLGRGVAYALESPALAALRNELASIIGRDHLTRQDAAPWRPHLTVQNKVAPEQARALLDVLKQDPRPDRCRAEALRLWRYEGGPWTLLDRFAFT